MTSAIPEPRDTEENANAVLMDDTQSGDTLTLADIARRLDVIEHNATARHADTVTIRENLKWVVEQVTGALTAMQRMPGIGGMLARKAG